MKAGSSVLNQKSVISCRRSVIDAEALDGGEDVVGRLDPAEGLRRSIMVVEKGRDGGFEVLNTAMNAAADLLIGQRGKEALDLVQPGTAGRGQMHMPARPLRQPIADQRGLVGGIVVPDQMHVEIARHAGFDLIEELAEFLCPMARLALADHRAGGDIERGEQRGRAMPGIVVAAPLRLAGPHRKHRLAAIQRLDLRLLIQHSTKACSGGAMYSPTTSRTLV